MLLASGTPTARSELQWTLRIAGIIPMRRLSGDHPQSVRNVVSAAAVRSSPVTGARH
jgi:hypothetical protein